MWQKERKRIPGRNPAGRGARQQRRRELISSDGAGSDPDERASQARMAGSENTTRRPRRRQGITLRAAYSYTVFRFTRSSAASSSAVMHSCSGGRVVLESSAGGATDLGARSDASVCALSIRGRLLRAFDRDVELTSGRMTTPHPCRRAVVRDVGSSNQGTMDHVAMHTARSSATRPRSVRRDKPKRIRRVDRDAWPMTSPARTRCGRR